MKRLIILIALVFAVSCEGQVSENEKSIRAIYKENPTFLANHKPHGVAYYKFKDFRTAKVGELVVTHEENGRSVVVCAGEWAKNEKCVVVELYESKTKDLGRRKYQLGLFDNLVLKRNKIDIMDLEDRLEKLENLENIKHIIKRLDYLESDEMVNIKNLNRWQNHRLNDIINLMYGEWNLRGDSLLVKPVFNPDSIITRLEKLEKLMEKTPVIADSIIPRSAKR